MNKESDFQPEDISIIRNNIMINGTILGEIRGEISENLSNINFQVNIYDTPKVNEDNKEIINKYIQASWMAFMERLSNSNWNFVNLPNAYEKPSTLPYEE